MNNLNGKLGDSFLAIMPLDDGTIIVQRIRYEDVDFKKECPPEWERSNADGTLSAFNLTLVRMVINYTARLFDCVKEWVR